MRPRRGVGPPIGSAERDPAIGEACLEKAMDLSTPGEAYYKRATRGESGQEMRRVIRIRPSAAWLVRLAVVGLVLFSVSGETAAQGVASATVSDDHLEAIGQARVLVREVMEASGVPGVSIAVARRGHVVWSEGFGWSDLEQRVAVTPLTKFRIGSVSKPMTGAALALLIEDGRLHPDDDPRDYVPEFPEKKWPFTVRQIAAHLSGIRHYDGDEFESNLRYPDQLSGLVKFQDDELRFEPGSRYLYSTYAWNLLSVVAERASGAEFLSLMRDRVFEPLGMRHTVAGHADSIVGQRTRFYERSEKDGRIVNAPFVDNSYKWGGGGFLSTPEDMIRFGAAHLEAGFFREETLALFFTPVRLSDGGIGGYGFGWRVDSADPDLVSHTGGSVGGDTILLMHRGTGWMVAAVGNLGDAGMRDLGRPLIELFSGS